jgi:hypothetical protein
MPGHDISIWDDPDVMRIYQVRDGQPFPSFSVFNDDPRQLHEVGAIASWIVETIEKNGWGPPGRHDGHF